jgi:hypothetical protein
VLSSKRQAAVFLAILSLTGCSKIKQVQDDMKDMQTKTADMKAIMGEILDSGRQGAGIDVRNKNFDSLHNSTKLEDKGLFAGLYFLGFEFQLWSKLGLDKNPEARDHLLKDAADEFFRRLVGITHWDEVDPFAGKGLLNPNEEENEKATFNALAATMERSNRKQVATAEREGEQVITMLSMVKTALRAGKEIKAGHKSIRDYPEYVEIILAREELASRLITARYQVMGLSVLGQLTPLTKNKMEGFKYKIWGKAWEIDLEKLNVAQLRLATFRLKEAQAAKDLLLELGIEVKMDANIAKIYGNATMKNAPGTLEGDSAKTEEARQIHADFVLAFDEYTGRTTN